VRHEKIVLNRHFSRQVSQKMNVPIANVPFDDDFRWKAPWRANAAARAEQTRLVANSAIRETGHVINSEGDFSCTNQGNCPRHGQIEALYKEVRANTNKALTLCGKQSLEARRQENTSKPARGDRLRGLWQRFRHWRYRLETGSISDAVYGYIHLADCALLDIINEDQLWGELPRIKSAVDDNLAADDESRKWLDSFFDELKYQDTKAKRLTGTTRPTTPREVQPEVIGERERAGILSALRTAYLQSAVNRNSLLSLQRMMRFTSLALFALLIALGVLGTLRPQAVPLCAQQACPTRPGTTPSGGDIFMVEFIGLLAAVLAGGATLMGRHELDIFRRRYAQLLLKAAAGGATAVLGLVLLISIAPNTITLRSQLSLLAFAAVFGYSQQAFTRLIDNKADDLRKTVLPPSTRAPLELSYSQSSTST
jgi:hypothetical protein